MLVLSSQLNRCEGGKFSFSTLIIEWEQKNKIVEMSTLSNLIVQMNKVIDKIP